MQDLMESLAYKGSKAALVLHAGLDHQVLWGLPESKVSLVQGDHLEMLEIRYTINYVLSSYYLLIQDFREPCLCLVF